MTTQSHHVCGHHLFVPRATVEANHFVVTLFHTASLRLPSSEATKLLLRWFGVVGRRE